MSQPPQRIRRAALCLATVLGIGAAAAALHALATDSPPAHAPIRAPTGVDTEADEDINPRRPC